MVFAQLKNGTIQNTIIIDDESILSLFQNNPITNEPYDEILRIDFIYPRPGIGWTFDGIVFNPPAEVEIIEIVEEEETQSE